MFRYRAALSVLLALTMTASAVAQSASPGTAVPYFRMNATSTNQTETPSTGASFSSSSYNSKVGVQFATAPTVRGGPAPSAWSLSSGALPPGMSLNPSTGQIGGVPTALGIYSGIRLTGEVTDANPLQTQSITINVVQLGLSYPQRTVATVGEPMSASATVSHGRSPLQFSVVDGSLPSGVALGANGSLTGTVLSAGPFSVTIRLVDGDGAIATATTAIDSDFGSSVSAGVDAVNTRVRVGKPVSVNATARGTSGQQSWELVQGVLPAGLSLNTATGAVNGTPLAKSSSTGLKLKVTDALSQTAQTQAFFIEVLDRPAVLTDDVYVTQVDKPIAAFPTAANIVGRTTWSLTKGTLPAGVSLSASTGKFVGTPTQDKVFPNLEVTVVDSSDAETATSAPFSVMIEKDPGEAFAIIGLPDMQRGRAGRALTAYAPQVNKGRGPIAWSTSTIAALAPGVALSPGTGAFIGTPLQAGSFTGVSITATDADGLTATKNNLGLQIFPPLAIADVTAAYASKVGAPFSLKPRSVGLMGTPSWTIVGQMPAGLSLDVRTGEISGIASDMASISGLRLSLHDDGDDSTVESSAFSMTIGDGLFVTAPSAIKGRVNDALPATQLSVARAVGATSWALNKALPAGLSLNTSTGRIAGTPTASISDAGFVATATDSRGLTGQSAPFTVQIDPVMTAVVPAYISMRTNTPSQFQARAENAVGAVTWSVVSGGLPTGLNFDSGNGLIFGTPTVQGEYKAIRLRAEDAIGAVAFTNEFTISVAGDFQISGYYTNGGYRIGNAWPGMTPTVTGASGKVTFSLEEGSQPLGTMTLDPDTGTISGPIYSGWFRVRATDQTGIYVVSNGFSINGVNPVWNRGGYPANGKVGLEMNLNCGINGWSNIIGKGSYSLSPTTPLPAGLQFDAESCSIWGVPTQAGDFIVRTRVTDTYDNTFDDSDDFAFHIEPDAAEADVVLRTRVGYPGPSHKFFDQPADWTNYWTQQNLDWRHRISVSGFGSVGSYQWASVAGYYPNQSVTWINGEQRMTATFDVDVAPGLMATRLMPEQTCARYGEPFTIPSPAASGVRGQVTYAPKNYNGSDIIELPAGVTMDPATGVISGVANAYWSNRWHTKITDSWDNNSGYANLQYLHVLPPLAPYWYWGNTQYADTNQYVYMNPQSESHVYGASFDLKMVSGELPPGMRFTGRAIEGVSTVPGSYKVTLQVIDTCDGKTANVPELTIVVREKLWAEAPATMTANEGQPFRSEAPSGHHMRTDATISWRIERGQLPTGLSVDPETGQIVGVPTQNGVFKFALRIDDAIGWDGRGAITNDVTLNVSPAPSVAVENPNDAFIGVDFHLTPKANNFAKTVTWSLSGGQLPDGLSMKPSTGVISGQTRNEGVVNGLILTATTGDGATASSQPFRIRSRDLTNPETDVPSVAQTPVSSVYWVHNGVAYDSQPSSWWVNQSLDHDRHEGNVRKALTDGAYYDSGEWAGYSTDNVLTQMSVSRGDALIFDYGKKVSATGWILKAYDMYNLRVQAFYEQGGTWVPFASGDGEFLMCGWEGIFRSSGPKVVAQRFKLEFRGVGASAQPLNVGHITETPPPHYIDAGYMPTSRDREASW